MTTQPSDWAVARAFWEASDKLFATKEDERFFPILLAISERARELDASGTTNSAQISSSLVVADWLPIESAPRDGRAVILAHMGGKPYIGKWCHDTWVDERGLSRGPSHWRPLPAPPTLDSAMQQVGGGGDHG